jgi:hypothetical protein
VRMAPPMTTSVLELAVRASQRLGKQSKCVSVAGLDGTEVTAVKRRDFGPESTKITGRAQPARSLQCVQPGWVRYS